MAELTADLTAETFATALLHAGRFREILHRGVVEALAPEHIERERNHFLFVELIAWGAAAASFWRSPVHC